MDNTISRNKLWCITYRLDGADESTTIHRVARELSYDEAMQIAVDIENDEYGYDMGDDERYNSENIYDLYVFKVENAEHVEGQNFDIRAYIAI